MDRNISAFVWISVAIVFMEIRLISIYPVTFLVAIRTQADNRNEFEPMNYAWIVWHSILSTMSHIFMYAR